MNLIILTALTTFLINEVSSFSKSSILISKINNIIKIQSNKHSSIDFENNLFSKISHSTSFFAKLILTSTIPFLMATQIVNAKLEGVNRPDLLPKIQTPLIDTVNFLSYVYLILNYHF